jgi:hypothetical protein
MVELKHRQQWRRRIGSPGWRRCDHNRVLLHPSSNTRRRRKNSDGPVGKRRRTPEAGRAMIATTYARKSTDQAIADEEIR